MDMDIDTKDTEDTEDEDDDVVNVVVDGQCRPDDVLRDYLADRSIDI